MLSLNKTSARLALAAALAVGASAVAAQQTTPTAQPEVAKPFRFLLGFGLTGGGDKLARVAFTNGNSESITAGGLMHLYAGGEYRFAPAVSAQVNLGFHVDDTSAATNGSLKFSRMPIELLGHYAVNDKVRLGGGLRVANSAKLKGSGVLAGSLSFKADPGVVVEGEYMTTPNIGIKLRAVSESYSIKGVSGKVSGDHVGLMLNYYF